MGRRGGRCGHTVRPGRQIRYVQNQCSVLRVPNQEFSGYRTPVPVSWRAGVRKWSPVRVHLRHVADNGVRGRKNPGLANRPAAAPENGGGKTAPRADAAKPVIQRTANAVAAARRGAGCG